MIKFLWCPVNTTLYPRDSLCCWELRQSHGRWEWKLVSLKFHCTYQRPWCSIYLADQEQDKSLSQTRKQGKTRDNSMVCTDCSVVHVLVRWDCMGFTLCLCMCFKYLKWAFITIVIRRSDSKIYVFWKSIFIILTRERIISQLANWLFFSILTGFLLPFIHFLYTYKPFY